MTLQSALTAGVISGAFSWYNIEQTHWATKACWYSGLIYAFASISAAGLCSGGLLRLMCHSDMTAKVRSVMGYKPAASQDWTPRRLQPWILGFPGMLLKLSLLWFLVGLILEIWLSARRMEFLWEADEVKVSRPHSRCRIYSDVQQIATFVTVSALFASLTYAIAVIGLFLPTVHHERVVQQHA